jgi:dual specificity tyrosine-phosphorylation-regulated kinase 2/3/4
MKGIPDSSLIELSTRRNLFFDPDENVPIPFINSRGRTRRPNTKTLSQALNNCNDLLFIDFLDKCLNWNPIARLTPLEAL